MDLWVIESHIIASLRLSAYQKAVVMAYLDTLIEWGDELFRQCTRETINEATQLYLMAAEILGDPPTELTRDEELPIVTFAELDDRAPSSLFADLENLVAGDDSETTRPALPFLRTDVFCVPPNPKLLGYWKEVEGRLYNIRHCLDLEGRKRPIPLWAPPIDPAVLVDITASGVDLDDVFEAIEAPLPRQRFRVVHQLALSVAATTKAFGAALLGALEKRDAETIAAIRSNMEVEVLEAALGVRESQIDEAEKAKIAIDGSLKIAEQRKSYGCNSDIDDLFDYSERCNWTKNSEVNLIGCREQSPSSIETITLSPTA